MGMLDHPVVVAAIVVVAAGYVILRRSVGEPINARDLAVPPLILIVLGVREIARGEALTSAQLIGLVVVGVLAVLLGAARAATVQLYLRDGVLWYRYRPLTYVTWGVTALVGLGARLGTYELTDLGLSLHGVMAGFKAWAEAHMDEVLTHRDDYDAGAGAA